MLGAGGDFAHSQRSTEIDERGRGELAGLVADVVLPGLVIPFGNLLGPLIIWQIKRDSMPFVAEHAKESLNFQITVSIAVVVSLALFIVLIGMLLLPLIGIVALILTIVAAIKANNGETYRYPFTLRLIR